jgi:hypothetical protein
MRRAEIVVTMWPEPGEELYDRLFEELYDRLFTAVADAVYDLDAEGYHVDVSASIVTPSGDPQQ